MTDIRYVQGDATAPVGHGVKILAHVCNDGGGWGRGFVVALSRRWRAPEGAYRAWYRDRASNNFQLGAVQFVQVEPELWVANMIGQHGIRRGNTGTPPIRYAAIEASLNTVADKAIDLHASVHLPRIGTGLAGGTWSEIEPLLHAQLINRGIAVTIYDLA
ncbi:macro domain-containing protein [Nocardia sp. NPDC052566]|uniref:macro domain-containing protein n=1 Tax=Nocardia sp. NPDC052566 TaxID=3364330 RepID=UPI0037C50BBA